MRPIEKLTVGTRIQLLDGTDHIVQYEYKPYRDAKDALFANIGEYCSYCERPASDEAADVEHVQHKAQYVQLTFRWSNFLLACKRCNGNDNKGTKNVVFDFIRLPHLDNTMLSIQYGTGGIVKIHSKLSSKSADYQKAKMLIDLVGLEKRPGHKDYLPKDKRWMKRDEVWRLAMRYMEKLEKETTDIEGITDLAKSRGFFSVWFTVFQDYPKVREALIDNFRGTAKNCFDKNNNFEPIPRSNPSA